MMMRAPPHAPPRAASTAGRRNLYRDHPALHEALACHAPGFDPKALELLGARLASPEMQTHARLAGSHPPYLGAQGQSGRRVDEITFHPSHHALLGAAVGYGLHGLPWWGGLSHLERAAALLMFAELEPTVLSAVSMHYAALPRLQRKTRLFAHWCDGLTNRHYDERLAPSEHKRGLLLGFGLESPLLSAELDESTPWGPCYRLSGEQLLAAAPPGDACVVLAQTARGGGPSTFFVPRWLPDGEPNPQRIRRLRYGPARPGAEVVFEGTVGWLLGDEGQGASLMRELGPQTRLDFALCTAGAMRRTLGLLMACAVAPGRVPQMPLVLADMLLESEAAVALALRLAATFDHPDDKGEAALRRLMAPAAKFWIGKRGGAVAQEAIECLDSGLGPMEDEAAELIARGGRDLALSAIWERAGDGSAVDLMQVMQHDNEAREALRRELAQARGAHAHLDALAAALWDHIGRIDSATGARRLAQDVALALQAVQLHRHAPRPIFESFCRARIGPERGLAFGLLPPGVDVDTLLGRFGHLS